MKPITTVEEGVRKLLELRGLPVPEFSFYARGAEAPTDTLILEGKKLPLFSTRFDCRLYDLAQYGAVGGNSALNVYSYTGKNISLRQLIYRETEIAEYILHAKVREVTAFVNGDAANVILLMEDGTTANLDLGTTMAEGSTEQCHHRLITSHGMANDVPVGAQTVQHQLTVFSQNAPAPVAYDDDEFYLYGLDDTDVARVLTIHAIMTGRLCADSFVQDDARYRAVTEAVFRSAEQHTTVRLAEDQEK